MKKLALLAVLSTLTIAPAYAADGFYAVGSVGWSKLDLDKGSIDSQLVSAGVTGLNSSTDESDVGYKLQLGYQFTENLAIEGGYIDLGKTSYSASYTGGNANAEAKARGVNLSVVYIYPINNDFSVFGKIGIIDARVKASVVATGPGGTASASASSTDVKPTIGFGATYNLNETVGIRAEYEFFNKLGNSDSTGESNVNLVSAGLVYKF
ncbi:outer membrane beta-barrel protein [Methyloradius palustris]|uniref:Membrane protein n=1 Tax=Methyloradius palustris TaxID=2778876 RepID=A0A8D5G4Z6_9PROT|nr:outer membrane beta-barrel protein [Methyloradius palustris]BCM26048.1 membrane protein [Methyloradius palustris]